MITLWGRNNSTNVKKVLWTLEELDLPFNQIMAGMAFGVNKEADYLAMNPNGLVPLLRDDETDATLWESNTIVRYLAAQYGQGRLWVENPARRAQGEKWMDWANQTLSPTHRVILMGLIRTPEAERDYPAIHAAQDACENLFAMMDDELAKHADWADEFMGRHPEFNAENAEDIIKFEIGQVFAQVLECAGVYKPTPEGREHLHKFLDCLREG